MRRAIALTANCPRLPFGALIVCAETGEVVAEGWNKSAINPTWHGEIDAINRLAESGRGDRGSGLVLYTTAEPCPMCGLFRIDAVRYLHVTRCQEVRQWVPKSRAQCPWPGPPVRETGWPRCGSDPPSCEPGCLMPSPGNAL
jgi:hypothetical protein